MVDGSQKVALITGGNRGLGLQTCRELAVAGMNVILTSRDVTKGVEAVALLADEGLDVDFYVLHVTDQTSVNLAAKYVQEKYRHLDVLVNNAGVFLDKGFSALETPMDVVRHIFEVNLYGAYRVLQTFGPLINDGGRVVNVSSGMGQLKNMGAGSPGYHMTKTAMNAMTRIAADELSSRNIKVNAVEPGWTRTDMGGPTATRSIEQGTDTIVWLALLDNSCPSGWQE